MDTKDSDLLCKFPSPKILLLDIDEAAARQLELAGYNVTIGSLGNPYRVSTNAAFAPVIENDSLPEDLGEYELVVVDLKHVEVLADVPGEKVVPPNQRDWWADSTYGVVDPRARTAAIVQETFDRSLRHGAAFVVFASPPPTIDYWFGSDREVFEGSARKLQFTGWSILSVLEEMEVKRELGSDIRRAHRHRSEDGLAEEIIGGQFTCTFKQDVRAPRIEWVTLATNKYEDPVASARMFGQKDRPGFVLVLPRVRDFCRTIELLVDDFLPPLCPHLFPYVEGATWVERQEYELPGVVELVTEMDEARGDAERRVAELREQVDELRKTQGYLHELLRSTGTSLVNAVLTALRTIGFQNVVSMDDGETAQDDPIVLREDLQIRDRSPLLVVEVKGISGMPRDEDVLAAQKYVIPAIRDHNRTDVCALSIINYERHLPAMDRNPHPFRADLLANALGQRIGLLTTWDLFRLVRGFLRNGWPVDAVTPLFYQAGRIQPRPCHYRHVGSVEKYLDEKAVVGIRLTDSLARGCRIAFELPVDFLEQDVDSLEVDRNAVADVGSGALVGTKSNYSKVQMKVGTPVYAVGSH